MSQASTSQNIAGLKAKPKATPIDVDELIRKKKDADNLASKPKFFSKADRKRIREEKEAKEKAQQLSVTNSISTSNGRSNKLSLESKGLKDGLITRPTASSSSSSGHIVPTEPKAMRKDGNDSKDKEMTKGDKKLEASLEAKKEQAELTMMRQRYLGPDRSQSKFSALNKRKRTSEKKFNFDWDPSDDTSKGFSYLYQNQPEWKRRNTAEQVRDDKMIHWSDKLLRDMQDRDWRIFKEDFNIATKGGSLPNPMRSWAESGLPRDLLNIIEQIGYEEPTPIQRAAIPIALNARDLIGVAVTGSGKTAAFLLPLLVYIQELPPLNPQTMHEGPYSLILAPTRELVQQIETEARRFAAPLGFKVVSIVGGHSIEEQIYELRDGAEIIVATPGRVVDLINQGRLVFNQCCYVVMDEADRMIDLGFEEPVSKILAALPVSNAKPDSEVAEQPQQLLSLAPIGPDGFPIKFRVTMMYTATMPAQLERIAGKYLSRPAYVTVGTAGEAVESVDQRFEFPGNEDRRKALMKDLLPKFAPPIIVFINVKRNCDGIAADIRRWGYSVVTMHSSKTQAQREEALQRVRDGAASILVATDVAGRGIDVPDVSLVINFNMPQSIQNYTHRIGRTGRAGKLGVSMTFIGPEDDAIRHDLVLLLKKSSSSKIPPQLMNSETTQAKSGKKDGGGGGGARF